MFAPPGELRPHRILAAIPSEATFGQEEEIILSVGFDSQTHAILLSVKDSIWNKLGEARRNSRHPTASEMAAVVGLQRKSIAMDSSEMNRWIVALTDSVRRTQRRWGRSHAPKVPRMHSLPWTALNILSSLKHCRDE
jgi:hypothetical protein